MGSQFKDFSTATRFLALVRGIIREEIGLAHSVRVATVVSWDRANLTCSVTFVEAASKAVTVSMGSIQPRIAGQKVRVERHGDDWFLTHCITQGSFMATS